jgi:phosphoglycerate dehydrogenase-like enzyme
LVAGTGRVIPVTVTFPDGAPAQLLDRVAAAAPTAEVVVCGYSEDMSLRSARGRGEPLDELRPLAPELTPSQRAAYARAEVLLAFDLPLGLGALAPALRWVQAIGAGVDHVRGAELGDGVVVTTAAGVAAAPIAEFVMGRLLAVWKRFDELAELQRNHEWRSTYGRSLAGTTMGLVGLGAIGSEVAVRARAFGMRVLALRRHPSSGSSAADEEYGTEDLEQMLSRCDAVVVCAPATPETRDLFDADAFAAMRPGAVFCNVARGSLVDEEALIAALERGHLGAAILDVTREEPLPRSSPLWDAPRVHLSPHSSASIDRYLESLFDLFGENLARYAAGQPLRNVVELPAGW